MSSTEKMALMKLVYQAVFLTSLKEPKWPNRVMILAV